MPAAWVLRERVRRGRRDDQAPAGARHPRPRSAEMRRACLLIYANAEERNDGDAYTHLKPKLAKAKKSPRECRGVWVSGGVDGSGEEAEAAEVGLGPAGTS